MPLHLKKQKEAASVYEAASRFIHDVFSIKTVNDKFLKINTN